MNTLQLETNYRELSESQNLESIIHEKVTDEGIQTVSELRDHVTGRFFESFNNNNGALSEALPNDEHEKLRTWQSYLDNYQGSDLIEDLSQHHAAGLVEKATNTKKIDNDAFELDAAINQRAYRLRVDAHEKVHLKQAKDYNLGGVTYYQGNQRYHIALIDLIEGHAIIMSNQPDEDLVPEYVGHKLHTLHFLRAANINMAEFNRIMKSGDLLTAQEHITQEHVAKQRIQGIQSDTGDQIKG